jgi:hypothetical protein
MIDYGVHGGIPATAVVPVSVPVKLFPLKSGSVDDPLTPANGHARAGAGNPIRLAVIPAGHTRLNPLAWPGGIYVV